MVRFTSALAAALALSASVGLALPASAAMHGKVRHAARARAISNNAYRIGFNRGFRAGQADVAREVTSGRAAALAQQNPNGQVAYAQGGYGGPFNNGGVLGTGALNGQGVLGTGLFDGQGAVGLGILGF